MPEQPAGGRDLNGTVYYPVPIGSHMAAAPQPNTPTHYALVTPQGYEFVHVPPAEPYNNPAMSARPLTPPYAVPEDFRRLRFPSDYPIREDKATSTPMMQAKVAPKPISISNPLDDMPAFPHNPKLTGALARNGKGHGRRVSVSVRSEIENPILGQKDTGRENTRINHEKRKASISLCFCYAIS